MSARTIRFFIAILFLFAALPAAMAEEQSIQNEFLKVTADGKIVSFYRVNDGTPADTPFATMPAEGEVLIFLHESDMLIIESQHGELQHQLHIEANAGQPFASILVFFVGDEATEIHDIALPKITLAEAYKPEALKTLGTAGLTAVDGHPGSYMFLAVANPETRDGVVAAWQSSRSGSGVVFSSVEDDCVTISPVCQYGRKKLEKMPEEAKMLGETVLLSEHFVLGAFSDTRLGLEAYADAVKVMHKIKMKPAPSGYCTWYSNKNNGAGNEESTREFADVAAEKLAPYGFNFFQIDDKWQEGASNNGPHKNFTTHRLTGPYRSGMKPTADYLREKGFRAGLWFMPFSGNADDPYYADKQAWFVKSAITYPAPGEKNTRRFSGINQGEGKPYETHWGGTCLDMTNPDVQAYLREEVKQIAKTWGYNYFKIDGMWTGMACEQLYVNDGYTPDDLGKQIFHDPDITNVEAFRLGCKMVREAAGDDVFILGCNISQNMRTMGASYGLVDAMRIGPDNGSSWSGICAGPIRGTARYFYNGRVWWNDPDPVYVRDSISLAHARVITSWAAINGQLFAFSDWLPELSEERVEVLRRTIKNHQRTNVRPVDLFNSELANVWHLSEGEYHIFGIFNWSMDKPLEVDYAADFAGLDPDKTYVAFNFWQNVFLPPFTGRLACTLDPATCRVLAVREMTDRPVLVSTSRHVASPILEVTDEKWDAEKGALTGVSDVVAGEVYELRIMVPVGENSWELDSETEWSGNAEKIETVISGCTTRVRFTPKAGGQLQWELRFKRAKVEIPAPATPTDFTAKAKHGHVALSWAGNAPGYIIQREGMRTEVSTTAFSDLGLEPDTHYTYTLTAKGWAGQDSPPVTVEATTPPPLVVPPVPPAPEVHISDLKPTKQRNGHGAIQKNKSHTGSPLTILGTVYEKGMGTHANSMLIYAVPEGCSRFVATVGIDDAEKHDDRRSIQANVYFLKKGGGRELAGETPVLRNGSVLVWHFDFPLPANTIRVELEINDAGDGIACDHGNWVNAGFLKE